MKITHIALPAPLQKSYHIALITDMHSKIPDRFFDTLRTLTPDLILLSGDIVDGRLIEKPHMYAALVSFAKLAPTFYATGNHEKYQDADRFLVKQSGVVLLENEDTVFEELVIGGLRSGFGHIPYFSKTPPPDLAYLDRFASLEGYKILLAHHPEYFKDYLRDKTIDLTVSGHAHGGQWRLGRLAAYAPGQGIFPRYTSGLYTEQRHHLVVSRGVGNHTRIPRIFNPTEIVMLHIGQRE